MPGKRKTMPVRSNPAASAPIWQISCRHHRLQHLRLHHERFRSQRMLEYRREAVEGVQRHLRIKAKRGSSTLAPWLASIKDRRH